MNRPSLRPATNTRPNAFRYPLPGLWLVLVLVMLGLAACRAQGTFRSMPEQTTPGVSFLGLPEPVTLPQLAENPLLYQGKFIRVSGEYLPPERFPTCVRNVRGPAGRWFLAGEEWELEVSGYEQVVPRLTPGTAMTVDGIFSYYDGPLGCGKGAARDSVWYLQAIHIEEPNPLPLLARGGGLIEFANGVPGLTFSDTLTATAPNLEGTAEMTATFPVLEPTAATVSPTPTLPPGTTPAATATTATTLATTPSATPAPTSTPTPTPTVGPGETPGGPPTQEPPSATPTPGDGYPPPRPTNTPGSYP